MSTDCNFDCGSCGESCSDRQEQQTSFIEKANDLSSVKKVIGVMSGKGGVGKSMVTSMLAVLMQRKGYRVGILDADVTGPSIPKCFGITEKASGSEVAIFPNRSKTGIEVMSMNLLLDSNTDPVLWRGPIIAGSVKQFWTDVVWSDIDYLFVDMPPGTGDVPITVFQSIPVDGVFMVTSPQDLVSMIVMKAIKMAELMKIPVLGIVENMAYYQCAKCGEIHHVFGETDIKEFAGENGIQMTAEVPIDRKLSNACDQGMIELFDGAWLDETANMLEGILEDNAQEA